MSHVSWTVPEPDNPFWPAWSPDGQLLYFTGVGSSTNTPTGMYRIRRDGTGLETLLNCFCFRPSISPDGRFMTFHAESDTFVIAVRVWDMVTRSYVGGEISGRFPEWSPAGNEIALYENLTGRVQVMNPDGTNRRYLTPPEEAHEGTSQLSWSAESAWILARLLSGLVLIEVSTALVLPLPGTVGFHQPALKP